MRLTCFACFIGASVFSLLRTDVSAQGLTVNIGGAPEPPTTLVQHTDVWRYHKGSTAPQSDWKTATDSSLDGTWLSGPGGIGYADNTTETSLCQTLLPDMRNLYRTVYIRHSFVLTNDVDPTLQLSLTMDWDDGFVAYLDGKELHREFAPGAIGTEPSNTDVATGLHESSRGSSGSPPSTFALGTAGSRLQAGTHIFAILGLNEALNSSDFIQIADLQVSGAFSPVTAGKYLSLVQSNVVVFSGSNNVANSASVVVNGDAAQYDTPTRTWELSSQLKPGVNKFFIAALDNTGRVLESTNYLVISDLNSTDVSGNIASSSTWSGVVHVAGNVTVGAGTILTIDPGTIILFNPGVSITANSAAIMANGTAAAPVFFGPLDGSSEWGPISVSGASAALDMHHFDSIAGRISGSGSQITLQDGSMQRAYVASMIGGNGGTFTLTRLHLHHYHDANINSAVVHLEDSLIEDCDSTDGDPFEMSGALTGTVVERVTLRRSSGDNADAFDLNSGTGVTYRDNLVHDISDKGFSIGTAGGPASENIVLSNNVVWNAHTGMAIKDGSTATIAANTIVDCAYGIQAYPKYSTEGGHVVTGYNNILWNNQTTIVITNGSVVLNYSDIGGTNFIGITPDNYFTTNSINADPLFVNAANHDYNLANGSPAVRSGQNGVSMGVTYPVGGLPGTPVGLAAIATGTNPVTLEWQDDSDNETSFLIERSTDQLTWTQIGTTQPNVTSFTDLTGNLNQKYYYRVSGINSSGNSEYSDLAGGTRQSARVNVGGTLTANTTWSSGIEYVVTSSLTVPSGLVLTVEPGVIVSFNGGQNLTINGQLLAEGTETSPIKLTSSDGVTRWGGITVNGSANSPETRITWAHIELNGTTAIHSSGGTLLLDHLTFGSTDHQYVSLDGSSFLVSNCYFPSSTAPFELVHGTGGIKSGGHGVIRHCYFGISSGYNDIIDFTGGKRPGPVVQFYNNVFTGSTDDILDIDGTDAWIEGNIFLHSHKNGAPDSSAAISGGSNGTDVSDITIVRNLFFDCDQAGTAKQGNFYTMINNTIVHMTKTGGLDTADGAINVRDLDPGPPTTFGAGYYMEGNIIVDVTQLVRNYIEGQTSVVFNNNILPMAWTGPGTGNVVADPLLKHVPQLSETVFTNWTDAQVMWVWFGLLPNSPAEGTGPNGTDIGGVIPPGASVSGTPVGSTVQNSATLIIGTNRKGDGIPANFWPDGAGYTAYKWRLDTNAWSAVVDINTPIALADLPAGPHFVEVSGLRDSGWFQDDPRLETEAYVTRTPTWTVTAGLEISGIQKVNGKIAIQFSVDAAETYSVLSRDTLNPATPWQKLADVPPGSSGQYLFTDDNASAATRFYQIVSPATP